MISDKQLKFIKNEKKTTIMIRYGRILISMYSEEHKRFIRKKKITSILVHLVQILLIVSLIVIWELLAKYEVINTFISSSPSRIVNNIYSLLMSGNLFKHVWVTLSETLIAFFITLVISFIVSLLIYKSQTFSKIIDPYLTIFNSLPKVAFGPILIIWIGANKRSIITMAILISIIVSIQSISVGLKNTNRNRIKILKIFGANEYQILKYVLLPSNFKIIINTCKINIGMCLIGIVMGEFLTSKAGIGYLILYGSQVFNLTLVMSGIVILLILSIILYEIISIIEKHLDF